MSDATQSKRDHLLATFLASSFFAEDEATPVVEKVLRHAAPDEERALLISYAREEDGHARLIEQHLAARGLAKGTPFWIQKVFRRFRARTTLLVQFYNVELLAGMFYGAMAGRVEDLEARALLRRLLRDEARHIRLHRELLARHIGRLGPVGRLKAAALLWLFRIAFTMTAWYQARQLAPVIGPAGRPLPGKIWRALRADLPVLFRREGSPPRSLHWWWTPAQEPA